MAVAIYRHGSVQEIAYTPASGNVAAGDCVILGSVAANSTTGVGAALGIAHRPITNNTIGSLSVAGGVYGFLNLNNAANGAIVFFDGTNKATTVTTNNALLGKIVANGGGGANTTCYVLHQQPNV